MKRTATQIEEIFCAGGESAGESAELRALAAMMTVPDALRAALITEQEKNLDPHLKVRSLLFRGNLNKARAELELLSSASNLESQMETWVEKARLECFEGEWLAALELTEVALTLKPSTLNRLSLHQIRGTAFFALQDFMAAFNEMEIAKSFEPVFPGAKSGYYLRILEVRLLIQLRGTIAGRRGLDLFWKELAKSKIINRDHLLSLLRVEIELARALNKNALSLALACFRVAELLGDQLYRDLALVDAYCFGNAETRAYLEDTLQNASMRFKRVAAEWENKKAMLRSSSVSVPEVNASFIESGMRAKIISSPTLGLLFNLENLRVFSTRKESPLSRALGVADSGSLLKKDFFKHVWGSQTYSQRLHDSVIWTTLSRLRNQYGVESKAHGDFISFENVLVINES